MVDESGGFDVGPTRLARASRTLVGGGGRDRGLELHAESRSLWLRMIALLLRWSAAAALALCLIEPLFSGVRPRPQANRFVILADNSQSLTLRNDGKQSRGEQLRDWLQPKTRWQTLLAQGFDVRRYAFDTTMRPMETFEPLDFQGRSSGLSGSLQSLHADYRMSRRPVCCY